MFTSRRPLALLSLLVACAGDDSAGGEHAGKADGLGGADELPIYVYGHRGAPFSEIENTLPSYAAALDEGANAIELDVCVTADLEAVLWHDASPDSAAALARQAGLEHLPYIPWNPDLGSRWRRPVHELTLAELREHYDYQPSRWFLGDALGVGERAGAHLPTFEEFADWSRGPEASDLAALFVDVKVGPDHLDLAAVLAERVADATEGVPYRVLIASPEQAVVDAMRAWFRANRPGASVEFAWDHGQPGALEHTRAGGYDVTSIGKTPLRRWPKVLAEVREAVRAGQHEVLVWTLDDDDRIAEALAVGVDGILTNRPGDVVRQALRGWADHDRAIEAIAACHAGHQGSGADAPCTTGLELGIVGALRERPLEARACDAHDDRSIRDVFGCGLVHSKDVRFETDLVARAGVVVAWDGAAGEVVVRR